MDYMTERDLDSDLDRKLVGLEKMCGSDDLYKRMLELSKTWGIDLVTDLVQAGLLK